MSITVDDTTKATIPGHVKISSKKFLGYYNITGVKRMYYQCLFLLPLQTLHRLFKDDEWVMEWISKSEHFKMGCANPAIVINKEKEIIATFTNLTSYGDEGTPVIKISKEKLHLITNKKIATGQRIPTVALYARNKEDPYASAWAGFEPLVPYCFSNDISSCDAVMNRLNANAWKCLRIGLEQINNKEELGLYYIELDNDLVYSSY